MGLDRSSGLALGSWLGRRGETRGLCEMLSQPKRPYKRHTIGINKVSGGGSGTGSG